MRIHLSTRPCICANYRKDIPYAIENQILEALIKAHQRGVKVRIILDRNVSRAPGADPDELEERSIRAAAYLKKNKVPVFFDDHQTLTHCKLIIFDGNTVILGSANWTFSGLKKNNEAGVLIRDKDTAETYGDMIDGIKLEKARK
ncbi:phospholipase D-like domain-containing protein [Planctomycetota bacterium]